MNPAKGLNIVLDIGKTNVKLVCFDHKTKRIYKTYQTKQKNLHKYSIKLLDTNYIYEWCLTKLNELSKKNKLLKFVCTAHACSIGLIDKNDQELLYPTDYEFNFSKHIFKFSKIAPNFNESFTPMLENGLSIGQQLFYLQYVHPELIKKTKYILFYPQYITWKLTNIFCSEISYIGCHSHLWNYQSNIYSSLIKRLKIHKKMPIIKKAWDVIGEKKIGNSKLKIINGVHDSNASYLYFKNSNIKNFTLVSSGTWYIVFNQNNSLSNLNPHFDMLANIDVFGNPVSTIRFMGGREYDYLTEKLKSSNKDKIDKKFNVEKFLIYPSYASGGPFKNQSIKLNKYLNLNKGQRYYLICVYIGFVLNFCLNKINSNKYIILDGPLGKNKVIMEILATLRSGQKILKNKNEIGTSFGATNLFDIHKKNKLNTVVIKPLKDKSILDTYNYWENNLYSQKLIKGV